MWTLVRACAGPICVTHLAPVGLEKVALRVFRSSFKCQHIHQPKLIMAVQQLSLFLLRSLIGLLCPVSRSLTVDAACHIWRYLLLTVCIGNLPPFATKYPRRSIPTDLSAAQSPANTIASAAWHQADAMFRECYVLQQVRTVTSMRPCGNTAFGGLRK